MEATTFHVKQRGLGKGLQALLGEGGETPREKGAMKSQNDVSERLVEIPLGLISVNPYQPRKVFEEEPLNELADSIKQSGVLQPISVRQLGEGKYELIMGERRLRASRLAGKETIPARVVDMTDQHVMEAALLENIQREDLTPIEEAEAYSALLQAHHYTQEKLAERVGKSRPHIANLIRLLVLPDQVKKWVNEGKLSMGHARALLVLDDPLTAAKEVISKKLSVRQTEALYNVSAEESVGVKRPKQVKKSERKRNIANGDKEDDILALESDLSELLGLEVAIDNNAGKGNVTIFFHSLQDLDKVISRLGQEQTV